MSQENVAVVLRNIETFEHDEEAWLSTADPALEWYPIEEGHSLSRGHEAAIRVRRSWLENWEGHQVDVDLRVCQHFKLRDGKIVYCYEYADRARPSKPPDCGNRALAERAQRQAGGFALRSRFAREGAAPGGVRRRRCASEGAARGRPLL